MPRGAEAALAAAAKAWTSGWRLPREDQDPEHEFAFGGTLAFDELWTRARPASDEAAWAPGVPIALRRARDPVVGGAVRVGAGVTTGCVTVRPAGPLPEGVTVLEASAGTGKTYAIAALAAAPSREGMPLDRLLAVTFSRAATGELRERIRERLAHSERVAAGGPGDAGDEIDALLAAGTAAEVDERRATAAAARWRSSTPRPS